MKSVIWSPRAIGEFRVHREWLHRQDTRSAERMTQAVESTALSLVEKIDTGRPSNFTGLREKSLPKWHKVIVYRISGDGIEIVALLDTRKKPPEEMD